MSGAVDSAALTSEKQRVPSEEKGREREEGEAASMKLRHVGRSVLSA
jgi:hypothetical protein